MDNRLFAGTTGANVIDAWIYTGYIQSLPNHLQNFPVQNFPRAYYGTRLTYLAPGYILQQIFGAEFGGLLLRFTFYLALVVFAYLFFRARRSVPLAAILAVCFLSSPFIAYFFIDDYPIGAGLCTIMMSMFFLEKGLITKLMRWWFLAGAAFALMLHTNFFLSVFLLPLGIYALLQGALEDRSLYKKLILFSLGAIAITALLGLINWLWGGQFLFFLPNIDETNSLLGGKNPWNPEGWAWIWNASWLALPFLGLLCSLWQFGLACVKRKWKAPRTAFAAANITICLIFIAFQIRGQPTLAIGYYAVYLVPFGMISIVDCVLGDKKKEGLPQLSDLRPVLLAVGVVIWWAVAVFVSYSIGFWLLSGSGQALGYIVTTLAPLMLMSLLLVFVSNWLGRYTQLVSLLLVLAVLQLWIVMNGPCSDPSVGAMQGPSAQPASSRKDCPVPRDLFREVVELHNITYQYSNGEKPAFWFDAKANPGLEALFNGVSGTFLWSYSIVAIDYPNLSVGASGSPQIGLWSQNVILAVMFPANESMDEGMATLRQNGIDAEVVYQENRDLDGWHYTFAILRRKPPVIDINMPKTTLLAWTEKDLQKKSKS